MSPTPTWCVQFKLRFYLALGTSITFKFVWKRMQINVSSKRIFLKECALTAADLYCPKLLIFTSCRLTLFYLLPFPFPSSSSFLMAHVASPTRVTILVSAYPPVGCLPGMRVLKASSYQLIFLWRILICNHSIWKLVRINVNNCDQTPAIHLSLFDVGRISLKKIFRFKFTFSIKAIFTRLGLFCPNLDFLLTSPHIEVLSNTLYILIFGR